MQFAETTQESVAVSVLWYTSGYVTVGDSNDALKVPHTCQSYSASSTGNYQLQGHICRAIPDFSSVEILSLRSYPGKLHSTGKQHSCRIGSAVGSLRIRFSHLQPQCRFGPIPKKLSFVLCSHLRYHQRLWRKWHSQGPSRRNALSLK